MNAPLLEVKVEALGNCMIQADRFKRNHGHDLIYDLLKDADLTGLWTFKIVSSFKSSGRTPPVQVRRPEQNGVHLWFKPGSNDSGIKGTLINRHPTLSHQQLYEKLKEAVAKDADSVPDTVAHIEFTLPDEDAVLILDAVSEVCADPRAYDGMNDFVEKIVEKLDNDEDADGAYWVEALEHLVDRKLLVDRRTFYELTGYGKEMLEKGLGGTLGAPSLNGVHKPVPVEIGTEEGNVLLKAQTKLAKIVAAAGKVTALRGRQRDVATQIEVKERELHELRQQLHGLTEEEHKAAQGIDIAALSLLLEEVQ
jgi:hypothetical protein